MFKKNYIFAAENLYLIIFIRLMKKFCRELKTVKKIIINDQFLGCFNFFVTLSLSLSLRYLTAVSPLLICAPACVNIRLSL